MKKGRWTCLVAILLMLGLAGCSGGTPKQEPFIIIGHVAALSGDLSLWGQAEKNALEMTADKINAAGGVAGKKLKIISYDNRGDASETVKVAQRLIGHDRAVAIIGPAQSSGAIVINSVMEPAKVAFIATAATSPKVTLDVNVNQVKPYAFRAGFIDSQQGTAAARFAGHQLKAKTAAVIYDASSEYSSGLAAFFATQFTKQGGKILANEAFKTNDTDFRPMLNRINQENPAVVFVPTLHKEAALLIKLARDMGMTARFIGGDGWSHPDILSLGGTALDGSYFIAQTALDDPDIQPFIAEYRGKFGQEPILPNAVLAADSLLMLVQAVQQAAGADPLKIAGQLSAITDLPVSAGKLSMDAKTHSPTNKTVVVQQIQAGKIVFFHKISGD